MYYNMVESLYNTCNRHHIAHPRGLGMGCFLWVEILIPLADLSLLCSMQYHFTGVTQPYPTSLYNSGISPGMHPANERCCYIVTTSLIGWVHTSTDPCIWGLSWFWLPWIPTVFWKHITSNNRFEISSSELWGTYYEYSGKHWQCPDGARLWEAVSLSSMSKVHLTKYAHCAGFMFCW